MATRQLHTYENVPISPLGFDGTRGWSDVPRALVVDWLAVLLRIARAVGHWVMSPQVRPRGRGRVLPAERSAFQGMAG